MYIYEKIMRLVRSSFLISKKNVVLLSLLALFMALPTVSLAAPSRIAAGIAHTIALKSDGTLWAWGFNGYGQLGDGTTNDIYAPSRIGSDKDWVSVAAGSYHTLALKSDGTLWAWGYNGFGQLGDGTINDIHSPTRIGSDNDWASIAVGDYHCLALKSDGTLWAWGSNGYGQLGDGTTNDVYTPAKIGVYNNWVRINAGRYHSMALRSNGTLWTWGRNSEGQLGDGTTNDVYAPAKIGSGQYWNAVYAGSYHSIALNADGTLWAWGFNGYGQLGDGTTNDIYIPTKIGTDNSWVFISPGSHHTVAFKSDGTLWAWGLNADGQLGDGTTTDRYFPVQVGVEHIWIPAAAGGDSYSLVYKSDGTLWAWGSNGYGQLGDGSLADSYSPVYIWTTTGWGAVSMGTYHAAGLKDNGTLWIWGSNEEGQLGRTATEICNSQPCLTAPGWVDPDNDWSSISDGAGGHHTMVLKSDGTLWIWGRNVTGQIGDGTTIQRGFPLQTGTDNNWVSIAAASHSSIAIKSDGSIWGWGANWHGQLGNGTFSHIYTPARIGTDNNWVTIASGHDHTVALKGNGTLWAWGDNEFGQLGDGTYGNDRTTPKQIGTGKDWVAIAAGFRHTVALQANGTLWTWGANFNGQLGDGTTIDRYTPAQIGTDNDWVAIAQAGGTHTVALKSDGTLWSWGYNKYGQLGRSSSTICTWFGSSYPCSPSPGQVGTDNDWAAVKIGQNSTHAIKSDGTLWAWGRNQFGQLGDGSTTDKSVPVQVNHSPLADPGGPYPGIEGQSIVLDGSGSYDLDGDIIFYEWDLNNDGFYDESSSSPIQGYTCGDEGIYTIKLRVTDNLGATDETATTVNISDSSPMADYTGMPTAGTAPLTVDFIDSSDGYDQPLTYEWDFDDDGTVDALVKNPSHIYTSPGLYTVKLTVTDSDGSINSLIRTDYITVTQPSYLLTVAVIGSGTVTSLPAGIDCNSGSGDCNETYDEGVSVTLSAVPSDASSTFAGWTGGGCTGTGNCVITMNAITDVTATFDVCSHAPVRNMTTSIEYLSLQDAYDAAGDGDTIQGHTAVMNEDLSIDADISVTFEGGYDCNYTGKSGETTLNGNIDISIGTVVMEDFILQ